MDIITQLQDQVNTIASISFNTFGSLQRDAPAVRLSTNYPEPPQSQSQSQPQPQPPAAPGANPNPTNPADPASAAAVLVDNAVKPKEMSVELVKAAKQRLQQFDVLVALLPVSEGGEEAQLKRIAELQAENDFVGLELQMQLEAAEQELKQVQELFSQASDSCLNMKKAE